jgi:hypothetical protein
MIGSRIRRDCADDRINRGVGARDEAGGVCGRALFGGGDLRFERRATPPTRALCGNGMTLLFKGRAICRQFL